MIAVAEVRPYILIVPRPDLKIYAPKIRTLIPYGFEAKISDNLESSDLSLEVLNPPVQIFQKNQSEDKGIYLVEINSSYTNFSSFNQNTLEKLKSEIKTLQKEKNIKHLIISFYDCHSLNKLALTMTDPFKLAENSWDIKGIDYFVDMLWEARTHSRLNNKKLSIIHDEPTLERSSLKELPSFIHDKLEDAIRNGNEEVPNYKTIGEATNTPINNHKPFIRTFNVLG